jgi:GntR family transcriptional regulator/MocR family aminotransferase
MAELVRCTVPVMGENSGPVVAGLEVPMQLDRDAGRPLREQLERALRDAIRVGRLGSGARLPSSRALAAELGVSRGVVTEAYGQLAAEGWLAARQGAPTRVSHSARAAATTAPARSLLPSFAYHFHPGLPDLQAFPQDRWLASLRRALRTAPRATLGYADPRGLPQTRDALAGYLARVRAAAAEPERLIVTCGFVQALSVTCRVLRARGARTIACEDPGWMVHRMIAQRAGLKPMPIPVDDQGLRVEALAAAGPDAVITTPAHQFPTGVALAAERRAALLDWARARSALVIEDDYDAEYRYDRGAVGCLQGMDPERVLYAGSASKRLAPGLRLGWLIAPNWLVDEITFEKGLADGGVAAPAQLALADFVARGELDHHLRRMRTRYRARRAALLDALARRLPEARVAGLAAGLYALVLLEPGVDDRAVHATAGERGVGFEPLSWHRSGTGEPGLVLGYANLPEPAIESGVAQLADAYRSASP